MKEETKPVGEKEGDYSQSIEERECELCNDIPDSVIYLSCEHIVCLVCAAKLIFSNKEVSELDFSEIECGICGELTQLSEEVQESIVQFLNEDGLQDINEVDEVEKIESEHDEKRLKNSNQCSENIKEELIQEDNDIDVDKEEEDEEIDEEEDEEIDEEEDEEIDEEEDEEVDEEEDEEIDEEEEEEENKIDSERNGSFNSEIFLNITCETHIVEECMYYNTNTKELYCPQCLIGRDLNPNEMKSVKSLRRSYPDILQSFQDLINQVEMAKDLFGNKKNDNDIRKNNCKNQIISEYKKLELSFNDLIDVIEDHKNVYLKNFEVQSNKVLENLKNNEFLEDKFNYYKNILESVSDLKNNSEDLGEEIFGYFFENQKNIFKSLKTDINTLKSTSNT